MEPVYRSVIGVAVALMKAMAWRVGATGTHHVPAHGPAVIATNHVGYLDFVFVGYSMLERGRLVRFMAKQEVFDHAVAGPLMRGMRHVPADRYGNAGAAIERSVAAVRTGEVLGMFPEGTISRSFVPAEARTGAARIAMAAGAPLVPGAIWGSQRILTKGRPRNLQRNIAITIDYGPPIEYAADDDARDVTDRLMTAIAGLVAVAERRYRQQPSGPDDRWWLPAHLGGTAPTVDEARALAQNERSARRRPS